MNLLVFVLSKYKLGHLSPIPDQFEGVVEHRVIASNHVIDRCFDMYIGNYAAAIYNPTGTNKGGKGDPELQSRFRQWITNDAYRVTIEGGLGRFFADQGCQLMMLKNSR